MRVSATGVRTSYEDQDPPINGQSSSQYRYYDFIIGKLVKNL